MQEQPYWSRSKVHLHQHSTSHMLLGIPLPLNRKFYVAITTNSLCYSLLYKCLFVQMLRTGENAHDLIVKHLLCKTHPVLAIVMEPGPSRSLPFLESMNETQTHSSHWWVIFELIIIFDKTQISTACSCPNKSTILAGRVALISKRNNSHLRSNRVQE